MLPKDMKEISILEKMMEESDKNVEVMEQGLSEIQRDHYLGSSLHREELWHLRKELEHAKHYNVRLKNRMEWGLKDPFG